MWWDSAYFHIHVVQYKFPPIPGLVSLQVASGFRKLDEMKPHTFYDTAESSAKYES